MPIGYDFSEDLSQLLIKVPLQPLTQGMPQGTEGLYNLFLRHPDGTYSLMNSAAPTVIPPSDCEGCNQIMDVVAFAGASSDFSHILFEADDILEGTGALSDFPMGNLYEKSGEALRLVGVLPDGAVAIGGTGPGAGGTFFSGVLYSSVSTNAWLRVNHAISEDGSKVVFQAIADGGQPDPAQIEMSEIYDRLDGEETIEISARAPGPSPANPKAEPAQFWAASTDGSLVFFTSSAELTSASKTGPANNSQDLYRFDVGTRQTTDLTVDTNPADAESGAGVLGVVGTSNDGSYVYFVATGELVQGKGVDGQPNLYVQHEDPESHVSEMRFIATLSPSDSNDWTAIPAELQAYVTPDGRHLAFMSLNELTGYDNTDQNTETPDSEVYEYGADAAVLACASCDPSGRRPVGSAFLGATLHHLASTPFHQPRVMSDDGNRLFFSSPDRLVARADSLHVKIYEHEQAGDGSCIDEQGCVFLISSASNATDDVFLDASDDGSDIFYATLSQQAATDTDNLGDVYDARVGGGFAEAVAPNECTDTCQRPQSAPTPPLIATGSSDVSGNLTAAKQKKIATKAQKLAKAIRACPRRPEKKRARCIARARKRYGVKTKGALAVHHVPASHRRARS